MKHQYLSVIFLFILTSCSSYKEFEHLSKEVEIPNKTFRATFVDTWTALKKVEQYNLNLDVNSQEAGILKLSGMITQCKLIFSDSLVAKTQLKRLNTNLSSMSLKVLETHVKYLVTIFKRQMVNQDFLQG